MRAKWDTCWSIALNECLININSNLLTLPTNSKIFSLTNMEGVLSHRESQNKRIESALLKRHTCEI